MAYEDFLLSSSYKKMIRQAKREGWSDLHRKHVEQIKFANWNIHKLQTQGAKSSPAYRGMMDRLPELTGKQVNRYLPIPKPGDPNEKTLAGVARWFTSKQTSSVEGTNEWLENIRNGIQTQIDIVNDPDFEYTSVFQTLSADETIELFTILNHNKVDYRDLGSKQILEAYANVVKEYGRTAGGKAIDYLVKKLNAEKDVKKKYKGFDITKGSCFFKGLDERAKVEFNKEMQKAKRETTTKTKVSKTKVK